MTGEAWPVIDEGNVEIWQLLMIMNTQWLSGFGGIYGINMQPIIESARELEIKTDWLFFAKVKAFEVGALKHTGGDTGCTEKKKTACREQFGENLDWACKNCEDNKP